MNLCCMNFPDPCEGSFFSSFFFAYFLRVLFTKLLFTSSLSGKKRFCLVCFSFFFSHFTHFPIQNFISFHFTHFPIQNLLYKKLLKLLKLLKTSYTFSNIIFTQYKIIQNSKNTQNKTIKIKPSKA